MHSDEYQISLSREIDVCRDRVNVVRKRLRKLEEKSGVTTAQFLEGIQSGSDAVSGGDAVKWAETCDELKVWETKQKEFEALQRAMK
jgi:hypothetical protein